MYDMTMTGGGGLKRLRTRQDKKDWHGILTARKKTTWRILDVRPGGGSCRQSSCRVGTRSWVCPPSYGTLDPRPLVLFLFYFIVTSFPRCCPFSGAAAILKCPRRHPTDVVSYQAACLLALTVRSFDPRSSNFHHQAHSIHSSSPWLPLLGVQ